jgi:predicted DNA-binding protein with PD1-like motif
MIKKRIQDIASIKNKYLSIILDDSDDVINSIEQAFKEQNIRKAVLISAEGNLKNIRIAISRAGTIRQRIYSEILKIKQVSGEFNKIKNDYFGDINISFEKDPIHIINGVLLKATSNGESTFKFKIIKDISYGINNNNNKNRNMVKEKILEEVNKKPKPMIIA